MYNKNASKMYYVDLYSGIYKLVTHFAGGLFSSYYRTIVSRLQLVKGSRYSTQDIQRYGGFETST